MSSVNKDLGKCFTINLTLEQAGKLIGVYELLKANEFIAYKEHIVTVLKEVLNELQANSKLYRPNSGGSGKVMFISSKPFHSFEIEYKKEDK